VEPRTWSRRWGLVWGEGKKSGQSAGIEGSKRAPTPEGGARVISRSRRGVLAAPGGAVETSVEKGRVGAKVRVGGNGWGGGWPRTRPRECELIFFLFLCFFFRFLFEFLVCGFFRFGGESGALPCRGALQSIFRAGTSGYGHWAFKKNFPKLERQRRTAFTGGHGGPTLFIGDRMGAGARFLRRGPARRLGGPRPWK